MSKMLTVSLRTDRQRSTNLKNEPNIENTIRNAPYYYYYYRNYRNPTSSCRRPKKKVKHKEFSQRAENGGSKEPFERRRCDCDNKRNRKSALTQQNHKSRQQRRRRRRWRRHRSTSLEARETSMQRLFDLSESQFQRQFRRENARYSCGPGHSRSCPTAAWPPGSAFNDASGGKNTSAVVSESVECGHQRTVNKSKLSQIGTPTATISVAAAKATRRTAHCCECKQSLLVRILNGHFCCKFTQFQLFFVVLMLTPLLTPTSVKYVRCQHPTRVSAVSQHAKQETIFIGSTPCCAPTDDGRANDAANRTYDRLEVRTGENGRSGCAKHAVTQVGSAPKVQDSPNKPHDAGGGGGGGGSSKGSVTDGDDSVDDDDVHPFHASQPQPSSQATQNSNNFNNNNNNNNSNNNNNNNHKLGINHENSLIAFNDVSSNSSNYTHDPVSANRNNEDHHRRDPIDRGNASASLFADILIRLNNRQKPSNTASPRNLYTSRALGTADMPPVGRQRDYMPKSYIATHVANAIEPTSDLSNEVTESGNNNNNDEDGVEDVENDYTTSRGAADHEAKDNTYFNDNGILPGSSYSNYANDDDHDDHDDHDRGSTPSQRRQAHQLYDQPDSHLSHKGTIDHYRLMKMVMDGLGLKKLPNMQKVNISQQEYATKYREYLRLVQIRKKRELRELNAAATSSAAQAGDLLDLELTNMPLQLLSIVSEGSGSLANTKDLNSVRLKREMYDGTTTTEMAGGAELLQSVNSVMKRNSNRRQSSSGRNSNARHEGKKTTVRLYFALKSKAQSLRPDDVEEANLRLMLIHSPTLLNKSKSNRNMNKRKRKKPSPCLGAGADLGRNVTASDRKTAKFRPQTHVLNLKVFQLLENGKRAWMDGRKISIQVDPSKQDETHSQWLQFDVTKAVASCLGAQRHQVELELQCENCKRIGARILNDGYVLGESEEAPTDGVEDFQLMPVINIIGRFGSASHSIRAHKFRLNATNVNGFSDGSTTHRHHHHRVNGKGGKERVARRINCYKTNQRCCRHSMEVIFKEIKGFEFIIQPKMFDAGYCHGRCPPRYNPAHHHAMLQSLIWKQNHRRAPRPCCAPSKLVELEVLHVDEKDSEKLKISTWSDMRVIECACS